MKIAVYQPSLTGNEKKYVNDCLDTSWISSKGKYNDLFADNFAEYVGAKYAATASNGTVALHLALLALGIHEGDEVIVPSFTYIASANAVTYTGAEVVFVDSLLDTWQMDPEDFERKITSKTKAVMAVHLYGHPCDMDAIMDIARRHNLHVVEDCAEAIGSEFNGKKVGSFGDIAAFSFFGNKTITCGEGGMVLTSNKELFDRTFNLRNQGVSAEKEYWHDIIGYNYRMTNIAAAIGLAQFEQIETFVSRKIEVANKYKELLKGLPITFHDAASNVKHTYWMVSISCNNVKDRDLLRAFLKENEIETRPTFYPAHVMPPYKRSNESHPVAEQLAASGMNLPSYPGLTDEQIEYVCNKIKEYYKSK